MSATVQTRLQPPAADAPVAADGQHSQAWAGYHQNVADRLDSITQKITSKAGVTDGSEATAGQLGEYLSATGSIPLASGVYDNVAVLGLTAGDWDVSGIVQFSAAGATGSNILASVSTVSQTASGVLQQIVQNFTGVNVLGAGGPARINTGAPVTMYLVARAAFTGGAMSAQGSISARRAR